jgi:hypothetical protein
MPQPMKSKEKEDGEDAGSNFKNMVTREYRGIISLSFNTAHCPRKS